jgi:hypothetical protein
VKLLRWVARLVFVVALVVWGRAAIRSMDYPETWAQSRRRTEAFIVMVAAGMLSFPAPKRTDPDEEETF